MVVVVITVHDATGLLHDQSVDAKSSVKPFNAHYLKFQPPWMRIETLPNRLQCEKAYKSTRCCSLDEKHLAILQFIRVSQFTVKTVQCFLIIWSKAFSFEIDVFLVTKSPKQTYKVWNLMVDICMHAALGLHAFLTCTNWKILWNRFTPANFI